MPVAPHNACSPVGTMASLHVAVCTPNFKIQETFDDMVEPWVRDAIAGRPEVKNGYFSLPEAPGLGVDLNEAVIAAHPPMEGFMDFGGAVGKSATRIVGKNSGAVSGGSGRGAWRK